MRLNIKIEFIYQNIVMNKLLTPLELKIMNVLWRLKKAFVKEIIEVLPPDKDKNPKPPHKPAYNTVSTTVRILEEKGFISHQAYGRTHQYFPVVSKVKYQRMLIMNVLDNAFSGSAASLVSALVDNEKIGDRELDEIQELINNHKK